MVVFEELVKKAKAGDNDAFAQLIDKNRLTMYKVAKSILSNEEDVADVISETILIAHEKMNQLREDKYFSTWLIRILINQCNAFIRHKGRTIITERECLEMQQTKFSSNDDNFYEILEGIDEKYKIILVLYYGEEFSVKEISRILGISTNTVKTRLKRGREYVRKNMERDVVYE